MKKDNQPLVSVIIPAYNAEKFLKSSVESVFEQTYKNVETIVVDDGSTDNTVATVKSFRNKKHSIRLVSKKNEGSGYARNAGVEAAKGEYIYFLDADDRITKHCLEHLVAIAEEENAAVVCTMANPDVRNEKLGKNIRVMNGVDAFCEVINMHIPSAPWGRLYRKGVIKDIKFKRLYYAEDFEFDTRFWPQVAKAVVVDDYSYMYSVTPGSMVNSPYDEKKAAIIPIILRLEELAKDKKLERKARITMRSGCFLQALATLLKIYDTGIKKHKADYKKLIKIAKRNAIYAYKNQAIDMQHRRFAFCSIFNVRLTLRLIARAYKKGSK